MKCLLKTIFNTNGVMYAGSPVLSIDEAGLILAGAQFGDLSIPVILNASAMAQEARARGLPFEFMDGIMQQAINSVQTAATALAEADAVLGKVINIPIGVSPSLYPVAGLPDGTIFYTAPPRGMRLALRTSSIVPDGIRVFATTVAGRVLFRDMNYGSPSACYELNWFISGTGDDANDGISSSTPLASLDELNIRLEGGQLGLVGQVTITLMGANTIFSERFSPVIAGGATVKIVGQRSYANAVVSTVTFTDWSNSLKRVATMVLPSGNWSALVRKPIEMTGHPGCIAWPVQEALTGTAVSTGIYNVSTNTIVASTTTEPFTSYTQASIGRVVIEARGHGFLVIEDINILAGLSVSGVGIIFNACNIDFIDLSARVTFNGCNFKGNRSYGPNATINNCSQSFTFGNAGGYVDQGSKVKFVGNNLFCGYTNTWGIHVMAGSSILIGDDSVAALTGSVAFHGCGRGVFGAGDLQVTANGFMWSLDTPHLGAITHMCAGKFWTYDDDTHIGSGLDVGVVSETIIYRIGIFASVDRFALPALGTNTSGVFSGFIHNSGSGT